MNIFIKYFWSNHGTFLSWIGLKTLTTLFSEPTLMIFLKFCLIINDCRLTKVIIKNMLRKLLLGKKLGISTLNFAQNLVYLNLQIQSKDFFFNFADDRTKQRWQKWIFWKTCYWLWHGTFWKVMHFDNKPTEDFVKCSQYCHWQWYNWDVKMLDSQSIGLVLKTSGWL